MSIMGYLVRFSENVNYYDAAVSRYIEIHEVFFTKIIFQQIAFFNNLTMCLVFYMSD